MLTYILRKIVQSLPVVLLASFGIFMLVHVLPADPALILAGPDASQQTLDAVRARFGLDKPLLEQYWLWLSHAAHGNMGDSFISHLPVRQLIGQAFPATLELAIATLIVIVLVGIPLGVAVGLASESLFDRFVTAGAAFIIGIPNFWLGILLILVFSVSFHLLPPSGRVGLLQAPAVGWKFLVLPVMSLAPRLTSVLLLFVRTSTIDVSLEDYVRTARAKGLGGLRLRFKHVLRNALIPVLTVLSVQFSQLLAGAIVIETVFAWPGIGRLLVNAVNNLDYPLIQAILLMLVMLFIAINILTDILYGYTDPRIRVGR